MKPTGPESPQPPAASCDALNARKVGHGSIRPARGWGAELRGPRGCSAFAREGDDVLISYLGSEEVDADETVR